MPGLRVENEECLRAADGRFGGGYLRNRHSRHLRHIELFLVERARKHLVGGDAVDGRVINAVEHAVLDACLPLFIGDGAHGALRRQHGRTLHNAGRAACIQAGNQRFTGLERRDGFRCVKRRIRAERHCGGADSLLVKRCIRAQCMLNAVAELPQNRHGDVARALGDKVHADALGANQPDDLLQHLQQRLRAVIEEQMRFIEEEHEARLLQIAAFRQQLVKLGKHPQQEG